jgi:hypothetical protein
MYLVLTSSKGISSVVMSRLLGTTQATAWRLGHAIREMTHDRGGPPLSGLVEIDLKYLGGAPKRRKDGQKSKRGKGTAKPRILIAVQRDDRMRATVVPSEKADDIHAALDGVVAQPVKVFSDKDHTFINVLKALGAAHQTVVHSAKEFVRGAVHSNTADGIGSLLERARMGVWHRMSRKHLQRYLDEIRFRWNCRGQAGVQVEERPTSSTDRNDSTSGHAVEAAEVIDRAADPADQELQFRRSSELSAWISVNLEDAPPARSNERLS